MSWPVSPSRCRGALPGPTSSASSPAGRAPGYRADSWPRRRAGCATRAWIAPPPSFRGALRRTWPSSRPWRPAPCCSRTWPRRGTHAHPDAAAGPAGSRHHRSRLLRRGGARPHRERRAQGGPGEVHPRRGAPGRLLRLHRSPPDGPGQGARLRAAGARGGCGRRHHGLHPRSRRRLSRRAHAATARGGRSPDARRRQHGRRPGPPRGGEAAVRRQAPVRHSVDSGHPGRAHRQGGPARHQPSRALRCLAGGRGQPLAGRRAVHRAAPARRPRP